MHHLRPLQCCGPTLPVSAACARHRAARGRMATSAPKYARTRIVVAEHFLTSHANNEVALADTTQHDVNTWLEQGASTRHRIRDFLRWAHARGLAADLQVHWLGSDGLPEQVLGDDERWTLLRRCLRDDGLDLRLRVAGALVLLYGQVPSRIVELTIDSVDQAIGQVIIGLSSASKASEGLGVSILGVLGRALELTRVIFQVPATFLIKERGKKE